MKSKKETSKQFLKNNILKCIYCNSTLNLQEKSLICENKHTFDIKKNGSIFLLKNSKYKESKYYTKELFTERRNFILNGYYDTINNYIEQFIKAKTISGNILDIGCGEGTHTHFITKDLNKNYKIYGIDYSKDAIDLATSYINEQKSFFVADVNNLPFLDNSIDIVIDYLSPFNTNNINKILKKGGYFIKVIPTKDYLIELRKIYNLDNYDNSTFKINNNYEIISDKIIEKTYKVNNEQDKFYLSKMTPLTWNVDSVKAELIDEITISLKIIILNKK